MPRSTRVVPENAAAATLTDQTKNSTNNNEKSKNANHGCRVFKKGNSSSKTPKTAGNVVDFTSVDKIIPDFSHGLEQGCGVATSWADACDNKGGDVRKPFNRDEAEEVNMFSLQNGEAPFLVGVKGRNISLIRKFSGMAIYIKNNTVSMIPQRPNASVEMAWRMVLSACFGGILRWFDTPNATKKGYPDDRIDEFEALASNHDASIDLLRSKRGHMCLMLIPQLSVKDRPTDAEIDAVKIKIATARSCLLDALQTPEAAAEP